jgi:hypothetical protein
MDRNLPDDYFEPSPGPWAFEVHRYGLSHVLLDRDGRVLGTHVRYGNGALMVAAPAMADLLDDLLGGVPVDELRTRARAIRRQLERHGVREPGDDDD